MKNRIVTMLIGLLCTAGARAQPVVDGVALAEEARAVLVEVMEQAGVERVRVTSTERSAAEQAEVMYGYIGRHGPENARRLYGPEGDSIIAVFERTTGRSRAERIAAMTAATRRLLPEAHANDRLMHTKDTHHVFDLAMSSIPADRLDAFVEAARGHPRVSRVLGPSDGEQEAVHLEVPKRPRNAGDD